MNFDTVTQWNILQSNNNNRESTVSTCNNMAEFHQKMLNEGTRQNSTY